MKPDYKRFLKFAIVGGSGAIVNVITFELFMFFLSSVTKDTRILLSNGIGILVSILTNFLLNDRWTWGDREKKSFLARLLKFYTAASIAALVQLAMTWVSFTYFWSLFTLVYWKHDFSPTLGLVSGISFAMFINFTTSHFWAFKDAT